MTNSNPTNADLASAYQPVSSSENRPWGRFDILLDAPEVKVKRLIVLPGKRLSLQSHQRREEHWVVCAGVATVTIGDQTLTVESTEGSSSAIFIPKRAKHRLANFGSLPLVVIETQKGDYFGEDDIERFDDDHGRTVQAN